MTLQEQMIKAMDEADRYSNKPFLREDAAKVCAEIAELYARSKWDEACEAQKLTTEIKPNLKQRIAEKYNEEFVHVSDVAYMIHSAPKPEFKP